MKLFIEAFVVGFITLIVGSIVCLILGYFFPNNLPDICKKWNKYHIMEFSLFLTGFIIHLICEFTGINKWYCKHGNACKKM